MLYHPVSIPATIGFIVIDIFPWAFELAKFIFLIKVMPLMSHLLPPQRQEI
jgi:hypothetical protein